MSRNRAKSRAKAYKFRRKYENVQHNAPKSRHFRGVFWNCNGLMRDDKPSLLANVFQELELDIMCVVETHMRQGSNEDLSSLNKHTVYLKERLGSEKKGGGLITIVKPGLNHLRWEPPLPMHHYLDAERDWVLIHENSKKLAFCSIYMAAEIADSRFLVWNNDLYAMITAELSLLRDDGYLCIFLGDFNGHIGNDLNGIVGNNRDINNNGTLVRNFVASNNLTVVNADAGKCEGIFTRRGLVSDSVLDLVIEDNSSSPLISSMTIDSCSKVLGDRSVFF